MHHVRVKMDGSSRVLLKSTKSSIFVQEFQELKASTAREVWQKGTECYLHRGMRTARLVVKV